MSLHGKVMFFNGIEWGPYGNWDLPFDEEFLHRVVSVPPQESKKKSICGKNFIIKNDFEDGKNNKWTGITTEAVVVSDGYLSDRCLYSEKSGDTRPNGFCFAPIPVGDGGEHIPLGKWCELRFKTHAEKSFGLGVLGIIATSNGNVYSFELSEAKRAPFGDGKWISVSMGFKLSMLEGNFASLDVKRYDWCYLLPDHVIGWDAEEKAESFTFVVYAKNADFWLDDVELFFEEPDESIEVSLTATPSLAAVGEEISAEYTVKNLCETPVKAFPYSFSYNPLLLKPLTLVSGDFELPPMGEKSVKAVFEVLEGGAAVITADGAPGVQSVSTRLSCTGRGFYFGDCHSHSTESDGKASPYENLKQYYALGMSFNVSADHNVEPCDTAVWDQAMQRLGCEIPNKNRFLQIKATENSAGFNHAVQYFSENRYDTPHTHEGWEEVIARQKADGGLTYIAHPFLKTNIQFWPILEGPHVILPQYKEADGFEIINSQTLDCTSETIAKSLEWWDRYNISGYRRYFGIGNSDGHRTYELGGSYNGLLLDELTEENIKMALRNGTLFFTTGPQLRFSLGGADMGSTVKTPCDGKLRLDITAYTPNKTPLEKIVVYSYSIGGDVDTLYQKGRKNALVLYERKYGEGDESFFEFSGEFGVEAGNFVRVEVYAERDTKMVMGNYQMAMSNPIWIVDGD